MRNRPRYICSVRAAGIIAIHLLAKSIAAQVSPLTNGTMHLQAGTTMEFHGQVEWQILADAQVINDGRIEFHDASRVSEAQGAPLTGSGTEHAWMVNAEPVAGFIPAGLGLELTSADPIGPLEIVRGHTPFILENGDESVARWFKFEAGLPSQLDGSEFHFDATELNGLTSIDLMLHDSESGDAPWVPIPSNVGPDQLSVIAIDHSPRTFLTAFRFDSTTDLLDRDQPVLSVWPTITSDFVTIATVGMGPVGEIELFDLKGRKVPFLVIGIPGDAQLRLDLSSCDRGTFLLRVDRIHTFKIVKT